MKWRDVEEQEEARRSWLSDTPVGCLVVLVVLLIMGILFRDVGVLALVAFAAAVAFWCEVERRK